ncbi:hypothetical protein A3C34_01830 [Candidatus Amesbacteria bacterium RIFCSPHIGHO2_02_FULL_48_21]|uniref:Uncharacterized protein n=3 Tax=Candidatus Amesiibacteriota TaxID=1752730 RepID=A0A1F5A266_9BACT|nr:MAG: hypothetical protein UX78_C0013G0007 [Candidatus Amesbacteria bacterium GW2011_GWA2_47_11]KKU99965.1 MAG: hypothetical protein UY33_C0018G0008 [Candidatus Amesbacteria bacterium GW2011_GWA1_48_9]OGC90770.1 MAG: hypothetical protein A2V48_05140 [Candidatus Amesbacteria bacterium RBG_19FT_COMBO_48_16]OGC95530.1 MAG: hypothetical protein A3C34_01830 [Candidatus Amesbacteria bacterium RIFCSPHIGHO2_02_FULL_48_21]OGC98927.1 MAG: hypothetical protein A2W16_02060 [Candidatus Amesbacteria bacter
MKAVAIVFALISLLGLYALKTGISRTPQPTATPITPALETSTPAVSNIPPSPHLLTLSRNATGSAQVMLDAAGINISAVAFRLIHEFSASSEIKITDADPKLSGIQVMVNPDLIDQGWVYPVNLVTVDTSSRKLTIDLSAINITPQGYTPSGPQALATLDFTALRDLEESPLSFDLALTKVITKKGDELTLYNLPQILYLK